MGLLNEYIVKLNTGWSALDLENELIRLIHAYNEYRQSYLFIYAAANSKQVPGIALDMEDYYIIHDLLADTKSMNLDFFLQTPGGSGEAAEDIARCLHSRFSTVSFIIAGEAKSAGTILALSGNEILMTDTASLGPIDAQIHIGRSVGSASDYMDWIEARKAEAEKNGKLNPVDATMVAQITPSELMGALNARDFARDLVVKWLQEYKFKDWSVTKSREIPVTQDMKSDRAEEIASKLINHNRWRSHGRSLKIHDLKEIGLEIFEIDSDPKLADLVYRIHTVILLLFESTPTFKIFATEKSKVMRRAVPQGMVIPAKNTKNAIQEILVAQAEIICPKCGKDYKVYAKLKESPEIDADQLAAGFQPFPIDSKIKCECGFEIDLDGWKNQIEIETGKKIIHRRRNDGKHDRPKKQK